MERKEKARKRGKVKSEEEKVPFWSKVVIKAIKFKPLQPQYSG